MPVRLPSLVLAVAVLSLLSQSAAAADPGRLQFTATSQDVPESAGQVTLTVSRTGGSAGTVAVMYSGDGNKTASAGSDYAPVTGVLTWADGDAADKTFTVPVVNDSAREGREAFAMKLSNPQGGARLGTAIETVYIDDDDGGPGTLEFKLSSQEVAEPNGQVVLTVSRTGGATGPVSVMYSGNGASSASAGADFEPVTGELAWADGDAGDKTFVVPIVDDNAKENREAFSMKLANPTGGAVLGRATETIYIADNETAPGILQFAAASQEVRETAGKVAIVVSRSGGTSGAVAVMYSGDGGGTASAGADFEPVSGVLSWGDGDGADRTVLVPIVDDTSAEPRESFVMKLSNVQGGALLGTRKLNTTYIVDDERALADADHDGVADAGDNCPSTANASQIDVDGDGTGDACDLTPGCPAPGTHTVAAWSARVDASAVVSSAMHSVPFSLPGGCNIQSATVQVLWQNRAEDLDLSVTQGSASYPSQRTNALDGPSEEVALAAPSGDFTADVSGFTNAGTDYRGRIRVTVGAPTECQAAFPATAPAAAATGPGMPFGQPTTLILSFTSGNARDAARAALLAGRLLGDADKARLHGFRHLPMLTLPVPAVTPELVDGLKAALRAYGLVSVWHDARIPLLNDQATAYTRVLEQRRDPALGFTGRGIGVAVIDSGVDGTQGDFANLRYNAKIVEGLAAVETPDSDTSSGHGTHVAGIIGGTGRMSGGQFAGVAPEATLLGFGSGDGDSIITLNALYAYDQIIDPDFQQRYNVRVTNNSYGGNPGPFDPADPIAIATKEAYDAGIVSVFAAGNAGPGANTMAPYALNPCVISAANGNTRGLLAGSSSRGSPSDPRSVPDITAPGTFITSTRAKTGTVAPPNRDYPAYATISGTSMASPHVAGIVALLLQANPALNFEQVLDILKSTATPMQDEHGTPYQAYEVGAGYVNALAAVQKAVAQPYAVDGVRVAQLSPGTPLEWHGYSGISLAPHGNLIVCLGCDTSGEKFPFVLPAVAGGYATLTVRLDYATPAEKLRLVVTDPSGASQASSVDGTASQQVTFVNPKPGRWTPAFFEELTATTSYRLTVTAVCAVAGCPANAPDADGDGVPDLSDNCPNDANPGQSDVDGDGIGDACDVPETACASPGLTLWRDPANDDTPPLPTAANGAGDILSLNVAEPADQFGKLVFTLKVRSLASLPPNVQWYVIFNGPPKSGYALGKWHVEMQTDETGTPTFSYGRYNTTNTGISEGPGAGDVPSDTAVAGSTYDAATGTITLVVDKSTFGDEGAALAGITANVYQLVGAFGAGSLQTIDAGGTGGYTLRAASACDVVAPDQDGDGWLNEQDNCPTVANADQADLDGDGQGDACDGDLDGDGVANAADAFPADPSESVDTDNDGIGNNADTDDDGDGIADAQDPCPLVPGDACGPIDTGARAVVAVIDSAFNPYHSFFYEGSAIYPAGSPPHAVTPALLAELGVDAAHQLQVTRTGNMATDLAADAALWATVKKGELYWFKGTNVLAISFAGSDGGTPAQPFPPLKPVWYPPASDGTDDPRSKNPHGTGTSSAVLKANPDAAIVFVETDGDLGNNAAHEWVRDQAAVDMFSTSYGVQLVAVGTLPETRSFHQVYEAVVQKGKMHFAAAGNNPGLTPLTGGAGPWWSIGVGGVEEDNYDVVRNDYTGSGQQVMAGNFPDFVGDYTQQLPYCLGGRYDATGVYAASGPVDCEAMINDNTPGTSFSTPRAAGVASRVLLEARRALGHAGGITTVDGVPVLAAGNGKVITNWFLRRALEQAAWIPPVTDRSTGNYITWEFTNVPVNPVAPWLQVGWGELTANPAKGVVSAAMAHLGLGGTPRDKGTGFCEFQTELVLERHTYWDSVAPNVPLSYTSNDGRTAHSGADPFIYCASLNPTHPPSNDPGGQ